MACDPRVEAARGALELIKSLGLKPRVLGIGTGRTALEFARVLAGDSIALEVSVAPSSLDSAMHARSLGLRVLDPRVVDSVDVYVDGADEVEPGGSMLKGGGGALLGEKIMAYNSLINIFIVSEDKLVEKLASTRPVPVEVEPGYIVMVSRSIEALGFKVKPRESESKRGPIYSDWSGALLDVETGPLDDPESLERLLKSIPGVRETGLFVGYADYIVVGSRACGYKVLRFERRRRRGAR